jgi:hypothetical protein
MLLSLRDHYYNATMERQAQDFSPIFGFAENACQGHTIVHFDSARTLDQTFYNIYTR